MESMADFVIVGNLAGYSRYSEGWRRSMISNPNLVQAPCELLRKIVEDTFYEWRTRALLRSTSSIQTDKYDKKLAAYGNARRYIVRRRKM